MGKKSPKSMKLAKSPGSATPPVGNQNIKKVKAPNKSKNTTPVSKKSPEPKTPTKGSPKGDKKQNATPKKALKRLGNNVVAEKGNKSLTESPKKKNKKQKNTEDSKLAEGSPQNVSLNTDAKGPKAAKAQTVKKQTPKKAAKEMKKQSPGKTTEKPTKKQKKQSPGETPKATPNKGSKKQKKVKDTVKKLVAKKQKAPKAAKKAKVDLTDISGGTEESENKNGVAPFGSYMATVKEQAKKAAQAILDHSAKQKEESLFKDLPSRISLEIVCFKVPTVDQKFFNILLPHSIYPQDADVVLVIKHDKKNAEDYQECELKTSLFKQKLLMDHGIKVREVVTLRQLRSEYSTLEAKRAFIKRIDALLVDKSIIKHVPGILGREIYRRKKYCIPVNMAPGHDIATEINTALKKTVMQVSDKGSSTTLVIGSDELNADQLAENIVKACQNISKNFPGGWPNVSKLAVLAGNLPPLPIYFSKGGPNDVKKPVKRPRKLREVVEDEITTHLNKRVKVLPDGKIFVKTIEGEEEDEEEVEQEA